MNVKSFAGAVEEQDACLAKFLEEHNLEHWEISYASKDRLIVTFKELQSTAPPTDLPQHKPHGSTDPRVAANAEEFIAWIQARASRLNPVRASQLHTRRMLGMQEASDKELVEALDALTALGYPIKLLWKARHTHPDSALPSQLRLLCTSAPRSKTDYMVAFRRAKGLTQEGAAKWLSRAVGKQFTKAQWAQYEDVLTVVPKCVEVAIQHGLDAMQEESS